MHTDSVGHPPDLQCSSKPCSLQEKVLDTRLPTTYAINMPVPILPLATWNSHMHCFDPKRYPFKATRAYTPQPAVLKDLIHNSKADNVMLVQATIEDGNSWTLLRIALYVNTTGVSRHNYRSRHGPQLQIPSLLIQTSKESPSSQIITVPQRHPTSTPPNSPLFFTSSPPPTCTSNSAPSTGEATRSPKW
ncbi:Uncharacterized protein HZ326_28510, partial [Fusarium oxysporum f. sp. albedinis]